MPESPTIISNSNVIVELAEYIEQLYDEGSIYTAKEAAEAIRELTPA